MRCWQAKQKLKSLDYDHSVLAQDQKLLNHLQECTSCASLVSAEKILQNDLQSASIDDNETVISDWQLRAQVERQAADANRSIFRENQFMAGITNLVKKQSKLTIGVTTIAIVLLLSVLIPFSYNQTIGYEVAFAGVDKNLAMDQYKLQQLLSKLGVDGAVIDVSGCEATCNVKITDLKSPDDAKLVKAAFNEIGNVQILEDVKAVFETKDGNIYKRLSFTSEDGAVQDFEFYADASSDDMHNVIVEKLGDDLHTAISVWVDEKGDSYELQSAPKQNAYFFSENGVNSLDVKVKVNQDGSHNIVINEGTPQEEIIVLEEGEEFSPEVIQKLNELGIDVHEVKSQFGGKDVALTFHKKVELLSDEDADVDVDESDDEAVAKTHTELPEGFELAQNYPNPFNPTTTINFTIPTSQNVSLTILNVRGQTVKTLINQQMSAGTHTIEWDATSSSGAKVASGIYFYRLETDETYAVKKMTLMK